MSSAKFRARITLLEHEPAEVEIWDDELTPFDGTKCSIRDWVKNHFDDYSSSDLRALLQLPPDEDYEALIEGVINGHTYFSPEVGEDYDEDIDIQSARTQKIPENYFGSGLPLADSI